MPNSSPVKINIPDTGRLIGVGLNKTGTTTLGHALNQIGVPTIDYPTDARTLEQLEKGDYCLDIFNDYIGVTDTPVGLFYPQLDKLHPGSKFILTIREKEAWQRSVRDHWPFVMEWSKHEAQFRRFTYYAFITTYGSLEYNEDRYSYVYDHYVDDVRAYFADRPDDLLVMDICDGDGWEKLCPFLGLPIPEEPFPHLNSKLEKIERQQWIDTLEQAYAELDHSVPDDATLVLVDEDQLANSALHAGRNVLPFTEADGAYNGPPADGKAAVAELARLQARGATHVGVAWPAFWWLEHYDGLAANLQERGECVLNNDRWKIYALAQQQQETT
jgi:hypothetical protein